MSNCWPCKLTIYSFSKKILDTYGVYSIELCPVKYQQLIVVRIGTIVTREQTVISDLTIKNVFIIPTEELQVEKLKLQMGFLSSALNFQKNKLNLHPCFEH